MSMWLTVVLWCVAGAIVLTVLIALFRGGRPFRDLFSGALQGVCALAAVNVAGMFTGVSLGINLFSGLTCLVMGVPGVITLLLLKLIFPL